MSIILRPYDIGCEPLPSMPAETVVQDGWSTYVLFYAVSKSVDETGHLRDLGVALLECQGCSTAKFGYPNDEGRPEHPLYRLGMPDAKSDILEVIASPWAQESCATTACIGTTHLERQKRVLEKACEGTFQAFRDLTEGENVRVRGRCARRAFLRQQLSGSIVLRHSEAR